jgi:hypothetical protein
MPAVVPASLAASSRMRGAMNAPQIRMPNVSGFAVPGGGAR